MMTRTSSSTSHSRPVTRADSPPASRRPVNRNAPWIAVTALAGLVLVLGLWFFAPPRLAEKSLPPRGSVEHVSSQSPGSSNGREPDQSAVLRSAPLFPSDRGAIRLIITDSKERTLIGIRAALLPPQAGGGSWDDAVISKILAGDNAAALGIGCSDAQGEVLFADLSPSSNYQIALLSEGAFYFDAQPTPFVRLDSPEEDIDNKSRRKQVVLDRSVTRRSLESTRVSGRIPATTGTITQTRAYKFVGASVRGAVLGKPWDRCVVSINRTDVSIRRLMQRSFTPEFEFSDLVPKGRYDVEAQTQRGSDIFFFASDVNVYDGNVTDIVLSPLNPDQRTELLLEVEGDSAKASSPIAIAIMFLKDQPRVRSDIILRHGQRTVLHGMLGARVLSLNLLEPSQTRDAIMGEPRFRDLVGGCFAYSQHTVVVPVRDSSAQATRATVRLIRPPKYRYSSPVHIKFASQDDSFLGSIVFGPEEEDRQLHLQWGGVASVRIRADVPDAQAAALTERTARWVQSGGVIEIRDPGPPNGVGAELLRDK